MENRPQPDPGQAEQGPSRRDFLKAGLGGFCALGLAGLLGSPGRAGAQAARKGFIRPRPSPWFKTHAGAQLECALCPHRCRLAPGQRGRCRVRENRGGRGYTLAYGNPCLVQLDPVERMPFFHVLPGTRALSLATAGCPLECRFCEVWDMALVAPEDVYAYELSPEQVVREAERARARSVSFAFAEPVACYEYVADAAVLARRAGLLNLLHSSAYINPEPLEALAGSLDGVNVDLKGFEPAFYGELCGGQLEPVLETLRRLKSAGVHIEITNLVIPTLNDDMERIRQMCLWIRNELGAGVPLHFARFYPLYKLANLPPTPVSTLDRARAVALQAGLHYVYVARVTGHEGENTFCPRCGRTVIRRMGFVIEEVRMDGGRCGHCGQVIPGRWS